MDEEAQKKNQTKERKGEKNNPKAKWGTSASKREKGKERGSKKEKERKKKRRERTREREKGKLASKRARYLASTPRVGFHATWYTAPTWPAAGEATQSALRARRENTNQKNSEKQTGRQHNRHSVPDVRK